MNNTNLTDTCKNPGQTPVLQKGGQFLLNRISLLNPYDSVIIKSFNDIAFSKFCFYWKYFNVIFSFRSLPPVFTCICEVRVVHLVQLHFFTFLIQCYDVSYDLCTQTVFGSFFTQISFVGDSCLMTDSAALQVAPVVLQLNDTNIM
jgi:hypothetical protein